MAFFILREGGNTMKRRFFFVCILLLILPALLAGQTLALSYSGSASYASGKYYTALQGVTLTGDARTDIVAVANSQIGYQEGSDSTQLSGEVKGANNYTEYGRWYGLQDMWCAMFVSWCANTAGVPSSVVPYHSFTVSGLNTFQSWGRAYTRAAVAAGTYTPQKGDIIYFKSSRNSNPTNHVGIVTSYSGTTVYTVEGNTSSATISTNGGAVCAKSYSITNTYIVYICSPDYTSQSVTPPAPSGAYFPACDPSYTTLAAALTSVGADGSYANRKRIAAANSIEDYSGTAAQNTAMLELLKAGRLIDPDGEPPGDLYFPACDAGYTTLAAALTSVGADGSYSYRKRIAAANDVENYSGTVDQNNALLALLKAGVLKKPVEETTPTVTYFTACDASYVSLADALRSVGADGSYSYRKQIAAANGIADYSGTPAQNTALLDLLKAGLLIVPTETAQTSPCGCSAQYSEHILLAQTCTEDGAEYDRCTNCGAITNRVTIPATGHGYVCTHTAATCTADGADEYVCSCGAQYTEKTDDALGHDFDAAVAANVSSADGVRTIRCTRCTQTQRVTSGDADGDGVLTLQDATMLRRYLAGWDVGVDLYACDVDLDGTADLKDAVRIVRHLAGWGVELV